MRWRNLWAVICLSWLAGTPVTATWSIVLADEATGEIAMGTVTCLTSFDLLAIIPVVVVEVGVAAVQASGDFEGLRRPVIFDGFNNGDSPQEILDAVSSINGHQSRQYGIVDTQGQHLTFSGNQTLAWTGGVSGVAGTISYAIQGNILTGACVVNDMEMAIINTPGDMPTKLMAAMQAAKNGGGDSRCSCPGPDPEACGCPVAVFDKAGHIGSMLVARPGDVDDDLCNQDGCADGDYFMRINVANQMVASPDPVDQLQTLFDTFRQDHMGRPDAGLSTHSYIPASVPPNGVATQTLQLQLNDWQDLPTTAMVSSVQITHAPTSDGLSAIGPITIQPNGIVMAELTAGLSAGTDTFRVVVNDGIRTVQLMPDPTVQFNQLGDIDGDGNVDLIDFLTMVNQFGPCPGGSTPCLADTTGDGQVDLNDVFVTLPNWQ